MNIKISPVIHTTLEKLDEVVSFWDTLTVPCSEHHILSQIKNALKKEHDRITTEKKDGDIAFETDWIQSTDVNVHGGETFVQIRKIHVIRDGERKRFRYMVRRKMENPDLTKYVFPFKIRVEVGDWRDARSLYEDDWCRIVCALLEGRVE